MKLHSEYPYDSLFLSGAERAIGAYRALNELQLNIPSQVAVLGIDNIPLCNYLYPSMSTMDQQCDNFAKVVIEKLFERINGLETNCCQPHILIDNRIIEREST